jgi:transposase
VESLLEEAHIKLSSLVTDLLGVSARRMLKALADGETNPAALATLADERLRATSEQLGDALGACTKLSAVYRRLLKMALKELRLIDEQIGQLDQEMASLLSEHQDAVQRLAEVPSLGVDSAQQIIAEVGPTAATFPSEKCFSSWVGGCPGDNESAGVNYSHRSPKGNRHMRRVLNQTANATARTKGSIFEMVYRRSVPRQGHNQAIGAIAHRQCRLIWLILHQGVRYEERGPAVTKQSRQRRTARMIRQLRSLGYRIEAPNPQPSQAPFRACGALSSPTTCRFIPALSGLPTTRPLRRTARDFARWPARTPNTMTAHFCYGVVPSVVRIVIRAIGHSMHRFPVCRRHA